MAISSGNMGLQMLEQMQPKFEAAYKRDLDYLTQKKENISDQIDLSKEILSDNKTVASTAKQISSIYTAQTRQLAAAKLVTSVSTNDPQFRDASDAISIIEDPSKPLKAGQFEIAVQQIAKPAVALLEIGDLMDIIDHNMVGYSSFRINYAHTPLVVDIKTSDTFDIILEEIKKQITTAKAPIFATKVTNGLEGSSRKEYIKLESKDTGIGQSFTISDYNNTAQAARAKFDGITLISNDDGQDAKFTIDGIESTSKTNRLTHAPTGVIFDIVDENSSYTKNGVQKLHTQTITVEASRTPIADDVNSIIDKVNEMIKSCAEQEKEETDYIRAENKDDLPRAKLTAAIRSNMQRAIDEIQNNYGSLLSAAGVSIQNYDDIELETSYPQFVASTQVADFADNDDRSSFEALSRLLFGGTKITSNGSNASLILDNSWKGKVTAEEIVGCRAVGKKLTGVPLNFSMRLDSVKNTVTANMSWQANGGTVTEAATVTEEQPGRYKISFSNYSALKGMSFYASGLTADTDFKHSIYHGANVFGALQERTMSFLDEKNEMSDVYRSNDNANKKIQDLKKEIDDISKQIKQLTAKYDAQMHKMNTDFLMMGYIDDMINDMFNDI